MSDSSPTPRDAHGSGSHYQPSSSVVLIIVVLFIGSTFLMVRAVSPSTPSPTVPSSSSSTTPTSPVLTKSRVRVQVANGTNTTGLAGSFTQRLMLQGWDTLPPGNSSAHVAATIIYYNPNYRRAALEIASTVRVSSSVVHPLNGANPIAGSSNDDVIVVLGPNSAIS